jgi:hypothetical protein
VDWPVQVESGEGRGGEGEEGGRERPDAPRLLEIMDMSVLLDLGPNLRE